MSTIKVDFGKIKGRIKPVHAVGQPPWMGLGGQYLHYLSEAHIPYARLHDMGGAYGGMVYVDVPNIFRDFDADETDPTAYDFAFTDILITKLMESGCKPYYRLGVTIENTVKVKPYRIIPPADFKKWARICEHIIRHYREGWADGFEYDIEYWEIWNECDNMPNPHENPMWVGTKEQYYELYDIASKHLKTCFGDKIKVGGYASSGLYGILKDPTLYGINMPANTEPIPEERNENFMAFFLGFFEYIKAHNCPLDFFSWHSYAGVSNTVVMEKFIEKHLEENGYGDVEIHVNEWNNASTVEFRGSSYAAATACEMMIRMHGTKCYMMNYYDARIGQSVYGGMFNPMTYKPLCTYYPFKAIGELYALGNEVECECDGSSVCLAAVSDDGKKQGIVLVNVQDDEIVECELEGFNAYLIDEDHMMEEIDFNGKTVEIKKNQVIYIAD